MDGTLGAAKPYFFFLDALITNYADGSSDSNRYKEELQC